MQLVALRPTPQPVQHPKNAMRLHRNVCDSHRILVSLPRNGSAVGWPVAACGRLCGAYLLPTSNSTMGVLTHPAATLASATSSWHHTRRPLSCGGTCMANVMPPAPS